jgi:hypothetical protein
VLGPNVVTYTYTDSLGCSASVSITIMVTDCGGCTGCNCNSVPPPPLPTITINSISPDNCHQDGCINATYTGCCLLFSFSYFDPCDPNLSYSVPQTNNPSIFCNLRAGTYTLYVQDGCGNMVQQTVIVPLASPPLTAILSYSQCADQVCVTAEGGCPPYTYNWSTGQTTSCISGYQHCTNLSVTVTDSRGCTFTKQVWVPQIDFVGVVNPFCCQSNGRICINVCSPSTYTISWSNGGSGPCVNGVPAGTYCVTLTNPDGDQVTCCYTLTASLPPTVSFVFNNCGNVISAVINNNGCQNYSYHWDDNSTLLDRQGVNPCDSVTFTIVTCDGIPHHHGFRVPHVTASISPVNCVTGLGSICIDVQCFRCEPFAYDWQTGGTTTNTCFETGPGFHNVCVTNSCGDIICCEFYLPPPISITATVTQTNVTCFGGNDGTVTIVPTSGTGPYTGAGTITGLSAGVYTFTITDANGCTGSVTVTITQPPRIIINTFDPAGCTGTIISVNGNNFNNITGVLFNGVSATYFIVIDPENLEVEVPQGATTGPITIVSGPCATVSVDPFTVTTCGVTVNVHILIEGYYANGGMMDNFGSGGCLFVNGLSTSSLDADSLHVTLVDPLTLNDVDEQAAILHTDGTASLNFGNQVTIGSSYYIKVQHRNALETWSANPVTANAVTTYDFASAQSQAYGNNMIQTWDGLYWAFYSGDISDANLGVGLQDQVIESQDYSDMENAVQVILTGYVTQDITGDGVVESLDYSIMENNVGGVIFTIRP